MSLVIHNRVRLKEVTRGNKRKIPFLLTYAVNFVLFPLENEAVVEVGSTTYSSMAASSGPVSLFIEVLSFLKKHIGNKTTEIISIRPCCCVDRMRTHCCSFPKSCPVFATPWTVSFPGFPVLHHLCSLLKLMY